MADDSSKPLLAPESFSADGIDLVHLEEVFEQLRSSPAGLSSEDAEARLLIIGVNKLEEKRENKVLKFLGFVWNPLSWVMKAAAVMAIVLANGGGEGPDWQDFVGIICLLFFNSTISFIEEKNAENATAALISQMIATLILVYAESGFASISGIGWGWGGVIWLYSLVFYFPMDVIKFVVLYALSGDAWNLVFDRKAAFASNRDSQRLLQGVAFGEVEFNGRRSSSLIADQARHRAEIARLGKMHTLRGHMESVTRLKNLDITNTP